MVHIICPANLQTGGPEVLHQLGYKLNLFGIEANMVYANRKEGVDPVCECYRKYNVPYQDVFVTDSNSIVVLPESRISVVQHFKNCKTIIWWLSVDFAQYTDEDIDYVRDNDNVYHLVQSRYAFEHLQKLNIHKNVFYLSDYLNNAFFDPTVVVNDDEREDVVLFNPKKGVNKTATLIMSSDYKIKWQALYGLTPEGMKYIMRKAKVYIDFGEHPGKDRIPREAAMCGCCVITNKNGSAFNDIDVAIPEKYKFDDDCESKIVHDCIKEIFANFSEAKKDFLPYVKKTSMEFNEFEEDVVKFFGTLYEGVIEPSKTKEEFVEAILAEINNGQYGKALLQLVNYRIQGHEMDIMMDVLEVVIRMGINEFAEAEICAYRGLEKEPHNYELYLNLAQIGYMTGAVGKLEKYAPLAIEYSKGTPDEEYVRNIIGELKS